MSESHYNLLESYKDSLRGNSLFSNSPGSFLTRTRSVMDTYPKGKMFTPFFDFKKANFFNDKENGVLKKPVNTNVFYNYNGIPFGYDGRFLGWDFFLDPAMKYLQEEQFLFSINTRLERYKNPFYYRYYMYYFNIVSHVFSNYRGIYNKSGARNTKSIHKDLIKYGINPQSKFVNRIQKAWQAFYSPITLYYSIGYDFVDFDYLGYYNTNWNSCFKKTGAWATSPLKLFWKFPSFIIRLANKPDIHLNPYVWTGARCIAILLNHSTYTEDKQLKFYLTNFYFGNGVRNSKYLFINVLESIFDCEFYYNEKATVKRKNVYINDGGLSISTTECEKFINLIEELDYTKTTRNPFIQV